MEWSNQLQRVIGVRLVAAMAVASLFLGVIASPAEAITPSSSPGQSEPRPVSDAVHLVELINLERMERGLPPVQLLAELSDVAKSHTWNMILDGDLYHNPDLIAGNVDAIHPKAWALGENVAYHFSVDGMHDAWMNSPGHRANILSEAFNYVGISLIEEPNGALWGTELFMGGPEGLAEPVIDPKDLPERQAGQDRFGTAAEVSKHIYAEGVDIVYIATGMNFPDALAAAGGLPGPILLTSPTVLPSATKAELERLRPYKIIVVGGESAVSAEIFEQLHVYGEHVVRVAGSDRFATATEISKMMFPESADRVYIATGLDFPDALAAAGGLPGPILLTAPEVLPMATKRELERLAPAQVYVIGGTSAVSDRVFEELTAYSDAVTRLAGSDRFATAVAVSAELYPFGADRVYVATGMDFPDALAAAGGLPGPILLTSPSSVPGATLAELQRLAPKDIIVVGGTSAVSDTVAAQFKAAQRG